MQLVLYLSALCSFFDEAFHYFQFIFTTRFESTGVVENELRVTGEYHLVIDIVKSTLNDHKPSALNSHFHAIAHLCGRFQFRQIDLTTKYQ